MVSETGIEPARDFSHKILSLGRLPLPPLRDIRQKNGAGEQARTADPSLKRRMLYRLSYTSIYGPNGGIRTLTTSPPERAHYHYATPGNLK